MFYVNDEPEGKFLYTETIKLYYCTMTVNETAGRLASSRVVIISKSSLTRTTHHPLQWGRVDAEAELHTGNNPKQ